MTTPELLPQTAALTRAATVYKLTQEMASRFIEQRARLGMGQSGDRAEISARRDEFWKTNADNYTRVDVAAAYLASAESARDDARRRELQTDRVTIAEMATASYIETTNAIHVDAWQNELATAGIDPDLMRQCAAEEVPTPFLGSHELADTAVSETFDELKPRPAPDPSLIDLLDAGRPVATQSRKSVPVFTVNRASRPITRNVVQDLGPDTSW